MYMYVVLVCSDTMVTVMTRKCTGQLYRFVSQVDNSPHWVKGHRFTTLIRDPTCNLTQIADPTIR